MIPKIAFILAAGLGTRMGEQAKHVPKPLWQIYNLSILEIVINQLAGFGITDIFVNTHHLNDLFESYCARKNIKVRLLFEPDLLGSGGCFLNLKRYIGAERVLALNADSFLDLDEHTLRKEISSRAGHLLFARKVEAHSGYNGFVFEGNQLISIAKPPFQEAYWTFSGVSVVDLSLIGEDVEKCSFFEKVVIPGDVHSQISFVNSNFFDFGTLENYLDHLACISSNKSLTEFLERNGVEVHKVQPGFEITQSGGEYEIFFEILGKRIRVRK